MADIPGVRRRGSVAGRERFVGRDREQHNQADADDSGLEVSLCPECGTANAIGAVICAECRTALVSSTKRVKQPRRRNSKAGPVASSGGSAETSRRRHPSVRARRLSSAEANDRESDESDRLHSPTRTVTREAERPRSEAKRAAPEAKRSRRKSARRDREAILWEGKLSRTQRFRQWIPASAVETARRLGEKIDAKVILAVGVAVVTAAAVTVALSLRPKPRHDTAAGLGLAFELTDRWKDVRDSSEWPGYFVVTAKILSTGAQPSLVFFKGSTGLAVLFREVATDTTPPQAALQDAEDLALVYGLSSDARLRSRGEVNLFGSRGTSFLAERWVAGGYYNEEMVVLPLGDRVVYVVYTAPQADWEVESREVRKILESARSVVG